MRRWVVLAVLLAAAPARAQLPEGYLVWSSGAVDDPGSRKLHRLTLPGLTERRTLTTGEDIEPQVSPDGRWIAYAKAKFPGGSDYHDFKLWRIYVVPIDGVGPGRRELKIDDDGAWPSWNRDGALFYNQADGTHSRLVRVELDDRGRVKAKRTVLSTKDQLSAFAEVNECVIAPDETWFAARTRGSSVQNGVSAFRLGKPGHVLLARAGEVGCMPVVAPGGAFGLIAGAEQGLRWGHGPDVPARKEDQLLVPARSPRHKVYHPGISTDGRWILAAQGTDADHNAGRYDVSVYPLDPAAMTVGAEQPITSADFNGWPHLWVGKPLPPPPPKPEVGGFQATVYTVAPGEKVTLSWSTFGAEQVFINDANVAPEGTQEVAPASTTKYTLQARGGGTSDQRELTVTVNPTPIAVSVTRFAGEPPQVERGRSATLRWEVQNAATLTVDGTPEPPTGAREVTPLETTTYVLEAQGHGGPVTARATVVVVAQQTGLLPDRGGFRCGLGGGASGGWILVALAAWLIGRRRR